MKTFNPNELLLKLQSCHSVLSTVWPRPGYPSLAGSGRLIHTKVFTALQNADQELVRAFQEIQGESLDKQFEEIWHQCHQIISLLKQLEANCLHQDIDSAFNMLYLTTGVLYQKIAETQLTRPVQDKRFSTVEDLPNLLKICGWDCSVNPELLGKVGDELESILLKLKHLI